MCIKSGSNKNLIFSVNSNGGKRRRTVVVQKGWRKCTHGMPRTAIVKRRRQSYFSRGSIFWRHFLPYDGNDIVRIRNFDESGTLSAECPRIFPVELIFLSNKWQSTDRKYAKDKTRKKAQTSIHNCASILFFNC